MLAPLGEQARPAGDDGVALDDALGAEARAVAERLDGGQLAALAPRGVGDGPADRMLGGVLERAGQAQQLAAVARRRRTTARSSMRPVVTVPVLSSTTVSTRRVDSSTSGPLIRMPSCAPRPVPTSSAVGVASPSAQGQAMISTATAVVIANAGLAPSSSQKASVAAARASTIGTKMADTRSARRCTGALPVCASLTRRPICASAVSAPTFVARTTRRPPTLTVPPATSSPGCFSTGIDSPVRSA